ncbi:peptide ABC transporter substrate-binding protein [Roseomonas sp. M0104]|uniref:Peptide ABC transporter substrate-binding protein n=1 Tax=Teichococcus coralli TaxID=2545983 RepID=A0A845BDJ3_9PROT|nr:ABC transporter substrate-binding protein [Pseudoroseomonas coralli]MXP64180.1 peptide ABC transporter substrate-binding protein [Pseudoroseomonas coralli]
MTTLPRRSLLLAGATLPLLRRPARAQSTPDTLRFGLSAWPPNLQPWASTGASAGTVKLLIHRSLVSYDSQGELRGELAESWSHEDDGAWVFRLRRNAVFHNGEPVTADDIKWTLEQIAGERSTAYMRAQFQRVERIETPDAHTLRLVTKEPVATLPHWFGGYNMAMVWRKSAPNEPVGAGPYRLTGQERGSSLELTAFDRFYKPGLPRLKRIRFVVYADENLRAAALQSGDVDMIEYVPWQSMAAVESDPALKLDAVDGPFMDVLFNGTRGPFADARVRRAVAHAIRREDIVKTAFFGRGSPLEGVPIPRGTPWYDEQLAHGWNYDPARAKALLAEAGHPDGFQTTLLATAQFGMHKDTAEVVQQHLAAIGIQCELRLPDWSTRVSLGTRGQYEIAIHGTTAENNDPDGLSSVLDTTLSPSHGRSFGVQAPRTAALLAQGRAEFDPQKRVATYKDMQRAALEEVPMVGLAWRSQGYGMKRNVQGFANLPGALTTLSGTQLETAAFA